MHRRKINCAALLSTPSNKNLRLQGTGAHEENCRALKMTRTTIGTNILINYLTRTSNYSEPRKIHVLLASFLFLRGWIVFADVNRQLPFATDAHSPNGDKVAVLNAVETFVRVLTV